MIELGPCEITGVFGPMASGKTYLIEQWLKGQNRYVRFDATGESASDPTIDHVWMNTRELYLKMRETPYYFKIAFHPGSDMQGQFVDTCRGMARLDSFKLLAVDEFHEVCSVSETPEYVRDLMRYARHARIAIIGASQRIADVHKLFTAGCRQTILFWTQEARDLDAIRDRWGRDSSDMVANLRPLIYDDTTKVTKQIPQCLVIVRGSKPKIYDFASQCYAGGEPTDSEVDAEEIPGEGSSDSEMGTGRTGSDVSQLQSSDEQTPPAEGSVPGAHS